MSARDVWALVTPVFEDGPSFSTLCEELARHDIGVDLEVLAVDDGSWTDRPTIESVVRAGLVGQIVRLKRNTGHQTAISVGLVRAAADSRYAGAIVMDCDGEDRPGDVPSLIAAASRDSAAAVAARKQRREGLPFLIFYRLYRLSFGLLTGRYINFGNFCALNRRALDRLAAMPETRIHLAAALIKSRVSRIEIPTNRGVRYHGRSRMRFNNLVLHGIRAVAVFDDDVLTRMGVTCAGAALAGCATLGTAVGLKLSGEATPGWLTFVAGFLIMVFLQTGILTLIALILSGLGFRTPASVSIDAGSLIATVESTQHEAS